MFISPHIASTPEVFSYSRIPKCGVPIIDHMSNGSLISPYKEKIRPKWFHQQVLSNILETDKFHSYITYSRVLKKKRKLLISHENNEEIILGHSN